MSHAFLRVAGAAAVFVLASCVTTAPVPKDKPAADKAHAAQIGPWGIDLAQIDRSVNPGDDFYRFVNGKWLANIEIPADRPSYGAFTAVADRSERKVREIVDDAMAAKAPKGSPEQRIGDLYASFMDEGGIEAAGLAPLKDALDQINAARTHDDVLTVMARPDLAVDAPVAAFVDVDFKSTSRYALYLSHAGLGLPDRSYYIDDDERFVTLRAAYRKHIEAVLALAGTRDPAGRAERIMRLETAMAAAQWERARRRDFGATYNPMTIAELSAYAPGLDWRLLLDQTGLAGVDRVVVQEKDAFPKLAKLFAATPVSTWRDYLTFHLLSVYSPYLPKAFADEDFAFNGRALSGQQEQRSRWRRGVDLVNTGLGFEVGKIYVERYFPPQSKVQMEQLVANLRAALSARIDRLDWMTAATKAEAHAKLDAFRPKIGYPARWKDYSALDVRPGDLLGNVRRAHVWAWRDQIRKLDGPVDANDWGMTPQTVNAYYSPNRNEIVFPAAILQPPFFDPNADPAVNYGAIGAVIGHEMGHGFDDQGRKSDGHGLLRDWWTSSDAKAFQSKADRLGAQYAGYEPVRGHAINAQLTMGENIGDLGGLTVALEAYHRSLGGRPAPVRDGFTGDQRFFMAWAQIWARKYREEELINRISTDPHSPSEFRTNGVVRNIDGWYAAFHVAPARGLYLDPNRRVTIW
jgi:predicted metalloendopeptidase